MSDSTADPEDLGRPLPAPVAESGLERQARPSRPAPPSYLDEFDRFYRSDIQRLIGFLVVLGASLSDAENFAQEAMIKAYTHWSTIKKPKAYVRTVASRDYARHMARVEEIPVEPVELGPLLPESLDIEDWEKRQDVLPLLGLLPPRQRQVMAWWLDRFSPSEIADELNLTSTNVRSNLKKARTKIAQHLGLPDDDGPAEGGDDDAQS